MFLPALVVTIVIAISVLYVLSWFVKPLIKYKDTDKLPGPSGIEFLIKLFGNDSANEKYRYVIGLSKKYGSVLKIRFKPFDPLIMVTDTEFIEKILLSKEHFGKSKMYKLFKPYIGDSLGTTSNAHMWRRERKISNVAFQHSTVIGFLPLVSKHTEKFLQIIRNRSTEGGEVDIQPLAHIFTLNLVFETVTGQSQDFQDDRNRHYVDARDQFYDIIAKRLYSPLLINDFFFRLVKEHKAMVKVVKILKGFTFDVIRRAKSNVTNSVKDTKHLLDLWLADKLEDQRLSSLTDTFIVAGSDTTALGFSFCLYLLSRHPAVQHKLYEEVTSKIGRDVNAEITSSDLLEMKYLEAVIKETLRIEPVAPVIDRRLNFDVKINGINYPKGTLFLFNLEALHRSEKYFKDPDKFDPERFMPENAHLIQRNTFIPFSVGPRDCVGKLYGMQFLKYAVAKTVQKFILKAVEDHELTLVHAILTKSETGIPIIFTERK